MHPIFLSLLFALVGGSALAQNVNVYNWSDYIAEDQLKAFAKESGLKVNYTTYDSNEILDAKLKTGKSGYDVVVPTAVLPNALKYLGLDPDSKKTEDFARAADVVRAIRPFVRKFHSSEYINALAGGNICLAFGYSGDVFQARDRAAKAREKQEIAYAIPKEGSVLWIDVAGIPKDAPNPDAAYK